MSDTFSGSYQEGKSTGGTVFLEAVASVSDAFFLAASDSDDTVGGVSAGARSPGSSVSPSSSSS